MEGQVHLMSRKKKVPKWEHKPYEFRPTVKLVLDPIKTKDK